MAGLPKKETRALIKALADQGAVVEDITVGVRLRLPDGTVMVVHWTNSDRKSLNAMRAVVKRAGLLWPFDDRRAVREARKARRREQS